MCVGYYKNYRAVFYDYYSLIKLKKLFSFNNNTFLFYLFYYLKEKKGDRYYCNMLFADIFLNQSVNRAVSFKRTCT